MLRRRACPSDRMASMILGNNMAERAGACRTICDHKYLTLVRTRRVAWPWQAKKTADRRTLPRTSLDGLSARSLDQREEVGDRASKLDVALDDGSCREERAVDDLLRQRQSPEHVLVLGGGSWREQFDPFLHRVRRW